MHADSSKQEPEQAATSECADMLARRRSVSLAGCAGIDDAALVALSRYRRDPGAAQAAGGGGGTGGAGGAGGAGGSGGDGPGAAEGESAPGRAMDALSLHLGAAPAAPRRASAARARVEGSFAAARAVHSPAMPAAAAGGGGGGLEAVCIAGCAGVTDAGVQVRLRCARRREACMHLAVGTPLGRTPCSSRARSLCALLVWAWVGGRRERW